MTPNRQGDFDGLCGIYALINACNAAIPKFGYEKRVDLFCVAVNYLNRRNMLKNTIIHGMSLKTLKILIKKFSKYSVNRLGYEIRFEKIAQKTGNIKGIINNIDNWLEENEGCFVVVGLEGFHNHWTCISKLYDKSFKIEDSCDLKRLDFRRLTSGELSAAKDLRIDKDEVLGIFSKKIP